MVTRKRVLLGAAAVLVVAGAAGAFVVDRWAPRTEGQPIAFPHDVHAGDNQIPCMYCHTTADRSRAAGLPAVQTCAGCHIPGGVPMIAQDRPEVRKLIAYWQQQRPIPWVRIYDVPDHAHFPHHRHVNAGVTCQECHGPVETMAEITKFSPLTMGWCIDCHRERGARTDCFVCHY
jgi:hypothetical protein